MSSFELLQIPSSCSLFFIFAARIPFNFLISLSLSLLHSCISTAIISPLHPALRGGPLVKKRAFGDSPVQVRISRKDWEWGEKKGEKEEVIPRDFPLVTSRTDTHVARDNRDAGLRHGAPRAISSRQNYAKRRATLSHAARTKWTDNVRIASKWKMMSRDHILTLTCMRGNYYIIKAERNVVKQASLKRK